MTGGSPEYAAWLREHVALAEAAGGGPVGPEHVPRPLVMRDHRPNGTKLDHPLYAFDCSCGYLSGASGVWYQTVERAREVFARHEIHPTVSHLAESQA